MTAPIQSQRPVLYILNGIYSRGGLQVPAGQRAGQVGRSRGPAARPVTLSSASARQVRYLFHALVLIQPDRHALVVRLYISEAAQPFLPSLFGSSNPADVLLHKAGTTLTDTPLEGRLI